MNLLYFILTALIVCTHGRHWNSRKHHNRSRIQRTVYEWDVLEFDYPFEQDVQTAVLIDVQPHYTRDNDKKRLRTFVTIPRLQDGIPYTLATVSNRMGEGGPKLEPYPSYGEHDNRRFHAYDYDYGPDYDCKVIVSACRLAITECNQMWVLDDGSNGSGAICPPQLFLFDLSTDQIIHNYRFEPSVYIPGASSLFNFVVDVRDPPRKGNCGNTMIYIADIKKPGLVVYDFKQNYAWRVEHLYMHPEPSHGLQSLAGERFMLMDGITGLATDKINLYFHPFASVTEYSVPLNVLDNGTLSEYKSHHMLDAFIPLGTRKSACTVSAMDNNKNIYCVTINPIELIKWNVETPYREKYLNTLPIRPTELQFISGMKVVKNHRGDEELWMVSNSYQKTKAGTRKFKDVNFRIVVVPLPSED